VQLYSLQLGAAPGAIEAIDALDVSTSDIQVLADRLHYMELCICPDTMVAHLSAALGRETWVMLHTECDWRWPARGDTTSWYPTMRLFRQRTAGDWKSVVAEMRAALSSRLL
jgi:ADP-heptose:LPS heptosyltransferase